jgi:tRNA pseudouridine(55) synthase
MNTGVVWKHIGETPLQAIRRFRVRHTIPDEVPLTYSGRLDPMAEGKILVLVGDECKEEDTYRSLDKKYIVDILFGISTDTGDVLGISRKGEVRSVAATAVEIQKICQHLIGKHEWHYPAYSSKPVHGKPLHQWAKEGKLHEITIPKTHTQIHSIKVISTKTISSSDLLIYTRNKIQQLSTFNKGRLCPEFRQSEIITQWENLLAGSSEYYTVVSVSCIAGSGTYMRTLAEKIGQLFEVEACALAIKRTKIGKRRSFWFINFWWPYW